MREKKTWQQNDSLKCYYQFGKSRLILYIAKNSDVFPGKKSKLSRENIRERRKRGEVREVKHSGTVFWGNALMHGCFWLQPCNNTKAHCSRL